MALDSTVLVLFSLKVWILISFTVCARMTLPVTMTLIGAVPLLLSLTSAWVSLLFMYT